MKTLLISTGLLLAICSHAANPSFGQFSTNDFTVVNGVSVKVNTNTIDTVAARVAGDAAVLAVTQTNLNSSIGTNYVFGYTTNRSTFFLTLGNLNVRSNYTFAGTVSSLPYWTNHLTSAWVISNGVSIGGTNYWCIVTNQTVPGASTNNVWYYHTFSDADGYPASPGVWTKIAAPGVSIPETPLPFPSYQTNTFNPTAFLLSPNSFWGPEQSNSTVSRVETWGNDTSGRISGFPFKSWDQVNYTTTNTIPSSIVFGVGSFSNQLGQAGIIPRVPLLDGQTFKGQGADFTFIGVSPGASATVGLKIGNSNAISDMTIRCVVGATNTSRNITNFLAENVVFGTPTNIDCIYFGGTGIMTDAQVKRCRFLSGYDTMNGVSSGTFTDCEWHCFGLTNDATLGASGAVRPVYLQAAGATFDDITLIRPIIIAGTPYTNVVAAQGCVVLQTTNCTLTILDGYFQHDTNLPAITQIGGFNSRINGNYLDVATDTTHTNVLSVYSVTIRSGVFTTNFYGDASQLTGTAPNGIISGTLQTNVTLDGVTTLPAQSVIKSGLNGFSETNFFGIGSGLTGIQGLNVTGPITNTGSSFTNVEIQGLSTLKNSTLLITNSWLTTGIGSNHIRSPFAGYFGFSTHSTAPSSGIIYGTFGNIFEFGRADRSFTWQYDSSALKFSAGTPLNMSGFAITNVSSISVPNATGTNFLGGTNNLGTFAYTGTLRVTNIFSTSAEVPVAVTVGASPFNFTNNTSGKLECYFSGATAYAVDKNGVAVYGSLAGDAYFTLNPSSRCTITYTVAPSMFTNSW